MHARLTTGTGAAWLMITAWCIRGARPTRRNRGSVVAAKCGGRVYVLRCVATNRVGRGVTAGWEGEVEAGAPAAHAADGIASHSAWILARQCASCTIDPTIHAWLLLPQHQRRVYLERGQTMCAVLCWCAVSGLGRQRTSRRHCVSAVPIAIGTYRYQVGTSLSCPWKCGSTVRLRSFFRRVGVQVVMCSECE